MAVIETPTAPLTPKPLIIERDYARENLEVQQSIAASTSVMAYTGVAALILSAIGVILIWRTFAQTQRAAEAAHATVKSFKDAERGRLISRDCFTHQKQDGEPTFSLRIKNEGRSMVTVRGIGIAWSKYGQLPENASIREAKTEIGVGKEAWATTPFPSDRSDERCFAGFVEYIDQFGDLHRTHFCREIVKENDEPDWTNRPLTARREHTPYVTKEGPPHQTPSDY